MSEQLSNGVILQDGGRSLYRVQSWAPLRKYAEARRGRNTTVVDVCGVLLLRDALDSAVDDKMAGFITISCILGEHCRPKWLRRLSTLQRSLRSRQP